MLSTVYSPLNRLRRNRSHCGLSAETVSWGRVIRKAICSGSSFSSSASRVFGLRRMPANQGRELPADDLAAEGLVVQPVVGQKVLVEKMPEGAVPDVVQQGGQPHERLDVAAAGHVGANLAEARVEGRHGPAGQVHRPQHVLEPGVFGRGKDPPGGLQLVNLPQPLEPGVVDDLLLGDLVLRQPHGRGKRNVAVDRIVAEALALEVSHGGPPFSKSILLLCGVAFQAPRRPHIRVSV